MNQIQSYRPFVQMLTTQLLEQIIDEAVTVLGKVGIVIENDSARKILADAGAVVLSDKQKVLFPEKLIEQCLQLAPKTFTVYDRDENPVMKLEQQQIHFNPGSSALKILDWNSRKHRKPVSIDIVYLSHLTQYMQHITAQSTALIATDVPQAIADRYRLFIALQYCCKPVITGTFSDDGFSVMKEMLSIIRGDSTRLRQQPLAIFDCCPTSPLKWSNLTCQSLIDSARSGIPVEIVPMPLLGATSPGTIAGTLVQLTAENLSGLVISQLACAGAPVILGGSPAMFEMRYGTTPMGAMETMLLNSAHAAICQCLQVPCHAYMGLSDSKLLDAQAGLETGIGAILAALSGINVVSGPGMLDFQTAQSLEKLVVDNEICGMALRLLNGIAIRQQPLAPELYGNIADGEHFLIAPSTLNWLREELRFPSDVIERKNYALWEQRGSTSIGDRAHIIVKQITEQRELKLLPDAVQQELHRVMLADAQQHGMQELPIGKI